MLIVKAALEKAGSTDPVALKDALGTVKNVVAATATIDMDPEGTPYKPIVILQIQNGVPVVVDRVYPISCESDWVVRFTYNPALFFLR